MTTPTELPTPLQEGYVLKTQLNVRDAWEIGLNDADSPGISPGDKVLVPSGRRADAPVLALQKWLTENEENRSRKPKKKRSAKRGK